MNSSPVMVFFIEVPGDLVQLLPVVREDFQSLFVLPLHQRHHLLVNLRRRLRRAAEGRISPQVLVLHRLQATMSKSSLMP